MTFAESQTQERAELQGLSSPPSGIWVKPLPLSPREKQILELIAQGLSSKEIGRRLGTAPQTVNAQSQIIKNKLNCKNWRELLIAAIRMEGKA